MKRNIMSSIILTGFLITGTFFSCKKNDPEPNKPTVSFTVSTKSVTEITTISASTGGSITVTRGTLTLTEKGVCYGANVNPTISLPNITKPFSDLSLSAFTSNLTGLTVNTTYHVRAYAISESGVKYGSDVVFTTLNNPIVPVVPTILTSTVTSIAQTSAISGGNITSNGGATVTASGICYATTTNPTISNNIVSSTTLTGTFTSNLTGLTSNTTYYVRAFATNSVGTAYGTQVSFTTLANLPTVTTTAVTAITQTTATSGGNITVTDGAVLTARGICWSTSTNPTITDSHTSDGISTGTFSSNLTGLTASTTYHVRAYATNNTGTAYGNDVTFTTNSVIPTAPVITTNAVGSITNTSAVGGGFITSNGGATITASGICYATTSNPTLSNTVITSTTITGSFSSNITGLVFNTTYYVRAYATNSVGTTYGNEVSFTTTTLTVGQSYQGGVIAYIFQVGDAGYSATVQHGIIAATSDQSAGMTWSIIGSGFISSTTSMNIGTGLTNTNTIVSRQGTGSYAAQLCQDLVLDGYNDWYLPSFNELNQLYLNRVIIGGFSTTSPSKYWSSSQIVIDKAAYIDFSNGTISPIPSDYKSYSFKVRAVRSF